MVRPKFLIIDGSSLVYRAFFALPPLQTKQGMYTNAIYGFTSMLLRLLQEENPDFIVVAFDRAAPTFRHQAYEGYKAKREKTPPELAEQMPYLREVLAALCIRAVDMEGVEADDIIGTFSRLANEAGADPVIVSGDADVLQLVDLPAEVIFTRRGISQVERFREKELKEKYGLTARQFVDYKGLKGDASDNIPGVPGVGEKTALKLLLQYGSLDGIYSQLAEIPGKLGETLQTYRDQAYLSKYLATIVTDVPLPVQMTDMVRKLPDYERLVPLFAKMEFTTLLEKLPVPHQEPPVAPAMATVYEEIREVEDYRQLAEKMAAAEWVAVCPQPPSGSWRQGLTALAVALPDTTYYLPLDSEEAVAQAGQLFSVGLTRVVIPDIKFWSNVVFRLWGYEPAGEYFDVILAAYLIDPLQNGYSVEKLAESYLNCLLPVAKPGKKGEASPGNGSFLSTAARCLLDLAPLLAEKLSSLSLEALYTQLELPLAKVLASMERTGVKVEREELNKLKKELTGRIASLEADIYDLAGTDFNLNSPKQLGFILFEKLGLPTFKKTKTGFSTDVEVLEELAPHHDIAAKILEYRMLIKLMGTYLEGLSKLLDLETGRVHTTFNQTVTATGRLSSTEPNLQNIPTRLEEGRRVRSAFVPGRSGDILLSADYSQIELRVLAHLSADPVLLRAFREEEDIHLRTAAEVFDLPPEEVSREMRDRAKAVNFGIVYGISDFGLSRQLGIPRKDAKCYIERYLERYPGVSRYMAEVITEARRQGYVTTLLNRRRLLPDINSKNFVKRSFAERTAMNTPIQGSAADIIKLAMLRVNDVLAPFGAEARMILQVHDELVFEVKRDVLENVAGQVKKAMEEAFSLQVPLTVDFKAGPNWAEMNKLTVPGGVALAGTS
jgi:DNA polymerase I